MTISEVYQTYNIMPTLADHQYRVAAVAKILCERSPEHLPINEIISGCLLHDMGNLIKFNLDNIPEGLVIPDIEHWKKVQASMKETYGDDEHKATHTIAEELGVSPLTLDIVKYVGTRNAKEMLEQKNIPVLLATYSDFRVTPTEVTTLKERIDDLLKRYEGTVKYDGYVRDTATYFPIEAFLQESLHIESLTITPEELTSTLAELHEFVLI
jgi:hypothetical protein